MLFVTIVRVRCATSSSANSEVIEQLRRAQALEGDRRSGDRVQLPLLPAFSKVSSYPQHARALPRLLLPETSFAFAQHHKP